MNGIGAAPLGIPTLGRETMGYVRQFLRVVPTLDVVAE